MTLSLYYPIIPTTQRKLLAELLTLFESEETFTITELEGFLFGLAITPDVIMPSEWIPEIFGGEIPDFDTEGRIELLFKNLLNAFNAYSDAFQNGKLNFPFDVKNIKDKDINDLFLNEMADWSYGLLVALRLRPEIWYLDYEEFENAPEDIQDILLSFAIIHGVVYPEDAYTLFEKDGKPLDEDYTISLLFGLLPQAVEVVKMHGERMWQKWVEDMDKGIIDLNTRKIKIGRNDPCPCGSGRKYKRCCGAN